MKQVSRYTWLATLLVGACWIALSHPLVAPVQAISGPETVSRFIDADLIRVGISDNAMMSQEYPFTQISATGPFNAYDKATGKLLFSGQAGDKIGISVSGTGFSLSSASAATPPTPAVEIRNIAGPIAIEPAGSPARESRLKITNITRRKEIPEYRGTFEVVRGASSPNKLSVINIVGLEDYLKAVVPNELPMRYGLEAVKAQAVAARNYAIRPREKPWRTFDICDSQLCQVYFGSHTETSGSNRAIAETEGMIGIYNGEPILALFSSSHGGYAEAYANAFSDPKTKQYPAPAIPYLTGGPDLPIDASIDLTTEAGARKFWTDTTAASYDVESPYYRWDKQWTRAELEGTIEQGLSRVSADPSTRDFVSPAFRGSIGTLKDIRVLARGTSGKAMIVAIDGTNGTWTIKKEFVIRKVFSYNGRMLPSGNVVFTANRDARGNLISMRAQGGGFGHGVGLSQLGASWMSKHGYNFPDIVQHYYKGVSLGSRPISVGQQNIPQPIRTRFDVYRPYGKLWIQEGDAASAYTSTPVTIQVNDKMLTITPNGFRTPVDIHGLLKPGELNTLMLFPDPNSPDRKIKAWVELYPPKETQTELGNAKTQ